MYRVSFSPRGARSIKALHKDIIGRILPKIDALASEPRPAGCKKLSGTTKDLWRIRIGNYRVIYRIEDEIRVVEVRDVGHRSSIYD